jgi:hypothetical protein
MNLTTYYTKYDYSLEFKSKETDANKQGYKWTSNIINYGVKPAFTYYINSNNTLHFGVQSVLYTFKPGKGTGTDGETTNEILLKDKKALEGAVYLDHEWKRYRLLLC